MLKKNFIHSKLKLNSVKNYNKKYMKLIMHYYTKTNHNELRWLH